MAETFDELLDLSELESSSEIAKFIDKDCGINNYVNTWEYVSYSYSRAFEALARKAFRGRGKRWKPGQSSTVSRASFNRAGAKKRDCRVFGDGGNNARTCWSC